MIKDSMNIVNFSSTHF